MNGSEQAIREKWKPALDALGITPEPVDYGTLLESHYKLLTITTMGAVGAATPARLLVLRQPETIIALAVQWGDGARATGE